MKEFNNIQKQKDEIKDYIIEIDNLIGMLVDLEYALLGYFD